MVGAVLGLSATAALHVQSDTYEDKILLQVEDCHNAGLFHYVVRRLCCWMYRPEAKSKTNNKQTRQEWYCQRISGPDDPLYCHIYSLVGPVLPYLPEHPQRLPHGAAMAVDASQRLGRTEANPLPLIGNLSDNQDFRDACM